MGSFIELWRFWVLERGIGALEGDEPTLKHSDAAKKDQPKMSDITQIISGILLLVLVFVLTRKVSAWRIKRAFFAIIRDLESVSAVNPGSAVLLPYAKTSLFRFGARDFRPKALEHLISSGVVGLTDDGRYYLKEKANLFKSQLME